ncbi:DUF1801 domain-containing protein [Gramella sp. AN32]|uniref:DUF1801 domain-containing protein n=1 Tax=Christiangramia antarctica TaxID=2058158 RepID=A0ABW5X885_9FLAO|nr:DUF1801 domain-containing protein [Gramella sp. AN32]MCM4154493.1 hypothetical protein [Gramella sp. AN32]
MKIEATSPEDYISKLPAERQVAVKKIREIINAHIPSGFEETLNYNMIGWVVPQSKYPSGYHCDPKLPLPFLNLASQKNYIALYHFGIYADEKLLKWFISEYKKEVGKNPDMGKSCIRFKNPEIIPYKLIAELTKKMTLEDWINAYEKVTKNSS